MNGKYDDIIILPHHTSEKHPKMSISGRAAQFAPFAALTGYNDAISETARITVQKHEPDEYEKQEIDRRLTYLLNNIENKPLVNITYFVPDKKKQGGSYLSFSGRLRRIDKISRKLIMTDGAEISVDNILQILCLSDENN